MGEEVLLEYVCTGIWGKQYFLGKPKAVYLNVQRSHPKTKILYCWTLYPSWGEARCWEESSDLGLANVAVKASRTYTVFWRHVCTASAPPYPPSTSSLCSCDGIPPQLPALSRQFPPITHSGTFTPFSFAVFVDPVFLCYFFLECQKTMAFFQQTKLVWVLVWVPS